MEDSKTAPPNGVTEKQLDTAGQNGAAVAQAATTEKKVAIPPPPTYDECGVETEEEIPPVAPDGGWGWMVVVASFFSNLVVDGVCYTFGIFYGELIDHFEESKSKTALVGSLLAGMYLIVGPIASALSNKFGCRIVAVAGSLIASTFFFISSYSTSLNMMLVTYGIFGGIGFGLMYLPSIVMVGYYFDKKRAVATGIAVCGTGIGTFVFAPLGSYLMEAYSWRGANIIMAGIILNGLVCGAIYRPLFAGKVHKVTDRVDEVEPSQIMQKIVDEKRRRQYSVDTPHDTKHCDAVPMCDVKEPDVTIKSHTSLAGSKRSIHAGSTGNVNGLRSRHASKVSHSSIEERRIFDRQDALYTGSLARVDEFKQCDGNIEKYVHSISALPTIPADEVDTKSKNGGCADSQLTSVITQMFDLSLLRSPTFILIGLSGFFAFAGLYTPFVFVTEKAEKELGIEKTKASLILSVLGASNTVSRILAGLVADHPRVDCMLVHNVAGIMAGVTTCLVSFLNSYELLMVYAAFFGVFMAGFITLRSIVIVELLGIQKLTSAFGLLSLCQGIAILIGSPLGGALQSATDSYVLPFLVSGGLFILGGVCCVPARRVALWERQRYSYQPTSARGESA
jgi:MFS family permease